MIFQWIVNCFSRLIRNTSITKTAMKLDDSFIFPLTDLTRSKIISLVIFYVSFSLLYCFGLALSEKPFGKWTFSKLLSFLTQKISFIYRKFPAKSMINVAGIARVSPEPASSTDLLEGFSMVYLELWIYFEGVWSMLKTS